MNRLEHILSTLDYSLDTKRRRHITGGILLSVSLLFGGLAVTVMSLRMDNKENEQRIETDI